MRRRIPSCREPHAEGEEDLPCLCGGQAALGGGSDLGVLAIVEPERFFGQRPPTKSIDELFFWGGCF